MLTGCPESYRVIDEEVREDDAAIHIRDFRRESVATSGEKQWFVEAKEAFIYQKNKQPDRIIAYEFRFEQFDKNGRRTDVMTAARGEIDNEDEMFYLQGNVFAESEAGKRRIRAESVAYDQIEELMTSDALVIIEEEGTLTRCERGAEIDNANNRQVCKGPIKNQVSTSFSLTAARICSNERRRSQTSIGRAPARGPGNAPAPEHELRRLSVRQRARAAAD